MPIRKSTAADVSRLMEELASDDPLRRETSAARLAVIGARAVTRLLAMAADHSAPSHARVAALHALESIGDARSLSVAETLAGGDAETDLAAIGVIGAVARSADPRSTRAFEWLAALALERQAPEARRLAAVNALDGLPARQLATIFAALAGDANAAVAARATRRTAGASISLDAAAEGALPDDPILVAAMIHEDAESAKVTTLRRLIEAIRARERSAAPDAARGWTAARGSVHGVLAARGSRLALYDLRETLEAAAGPLPVGFLAAAAAIGDAACLEPLAAAWVAASPDDRWWRDHLAEVFRAIVVREALSRRHPVLKKILERQPTAAVLVATAKKA
jgi:hypothetical protein